MLAAAKQIEVGFGPGKRASPSRSRASRAAFWKLSTPSSGAKERLDGDTKSNLLEIALACGFRSKATFNRICKQHTGVTPTQYHASTAGAW